jgi:hypothetical protein
MFKIFKTIKESVVKIDKLSEKLKILEAKNEKLNKNIDDRNIYTAIGIPFIENYDKRIQLFMEARKRGFFDDENYFTPIDGGWSDTTYFKHHYSAVASNYGYDEKTDTLRMSVIGVNGNFSACRVTIYKEGKWAELKTDK